MKIDKLALVFICGLILRFFLMSFFYHPDLKSQYFHGHFLSSGVFNIYSYIASQRGHLPYNDTFNYPPLAYFFLGGGEAFAQIVAGPGLPNWLGNWNQSSLRDAQMPIYLFWLKIPYLVADLAFLLLLLKYSPPKKQEFAAYLWAFNPISLYAIYMVGQFDILPALLTLLAYLFANKKKYLLAVGFISLAIAFKTYPLFLLPFIFFRIPAIRQFIYSLLVFFLITSAWVLPFLNTAGFVASVFQSSLGQRLFIAGIDLGFGEKLPIFFISYAILLCVSWVHRKQVDMLPEFIITTSAILLFGHFHSQWAVWSLPFWLIFLVRNSRYLIYFLPASFFFFATIFLLPDQYTLVGMFTPFNPQLLVIPPMTDFLQLLISPSLLQGWFHALFSGTLLFISYYVWQTTYES